MSELGDVFSAWKQERRVIKESNKTFSTQLLVDKNIPFSSHNNGYHLVVMLKYDFWPSTGKWFDRENRKRGFGVFNLLKILPKETS